MVQKIQEFNSGPAILVERLNEIISAINVLNNMTGDGFIQAKKTIGGVAFSLSLKKIQERMAKVGDGGVEGNQIEWFQLSAVGSNPMTGRKQTCSAGTFSEETGEEDVSIYRYPQFTNQTSYEVNDIIAAIFVGDSWVSLYNTPHEIYECT